MESGCYPNVPLTFYKFFGPPSAGLTISVSDFYYHYTAVKKDKSLRADLESSIRLNLVRTRQLQWGSKAGHGC